MSGRDIDAEIERLKEACEEEMLNINWATLERHTALREQLRREDEGNRFNIEVCRIRLRQQIERLERERAGNETETGPIMNLPAELISHIFRYHVESGSSPWELVKVCKAWKKSAFATPCLWRYICVALANTYNHDFDRIATESMQNNTPNWQICSSMPHLQATLERSRAVPLHVRAENLEFPEPVPTTLLSLLCTLVSSPVSERIETLILTAWITPRDILPTSVSIGPFTRLVSLHLLDPSDTWSNILLESIDSTACQLEEIHLECVIPRELTKHKFWSRLKRLYLGSPHEIGPFNDLAEKLVRIEELPACPFLWPHEGTPAVTWAYIREIELNCMPRFLNRLNLPKLEVLKFTDTELEDTLQGRQDDVPVLSFPNLQALIINTPNPQWFSNLLAPSLICLSLIWVKADYPIPIDTSTFFSNTIFSRIQFIIIQAPSDAGLISALENAVNVCRVEVLSGHNQGFGLKLLARLDATKLPVLCPKLISLSLGSMRSPVSTVKKKALPLIKRVVASRKKIQAPLAKLSVCWSKTKYEVKNYA